MSLTIFRTTQRPLNSHSGFVQRRAPLVLARQWQRQLPSPSDITSERETGLGRAARSLRVHDGGLEVKPTRKTALITGVLFIITIVFSIPGALLYGPLLNDPHYIVGPGADTLW